MEAPESNAGKAERYPTASLANVIDVDNLRSRLSALNDDPVFQREISRSLTPLAGHQLPPVAVAGAIILAINRYTRGDIDRPTSQLASLFIPHIVDAMIETVGERDAVLRELGMVGSPETWTVT
jgi:hypothetical protein